MHSKTKRKKEDAAPPAAEPRLSIPLAVRDGHHATLPEATPVAQTAEPEPGATDSVAKPAPVDQKPESAATVEVPPALIIEPPYAESAAAAPVVEATNAVTTEASEPPADQQQEPEPAQSEPAIATASATESVAEFTEQDRRDLVRLEATGKASGIEAARCQREIRRRKLWKLHRNEDGTQRYTTYKAYCEEEIGYPTSWVSRQEKWLANMERLADLHAQGHAVPPILSANASDGLYRLRECAGYHGDVDDDLEMQQETEGLLLVLDECVREGLTFTGDHLKKITTRRADYHYRRRTANPPLATDYDTYKQDLLVAANLGKGTWGIVTDAKKQPGDIAENVLRLCAERNKLPVAEDLLTVVTGKALEDIVARLGNLAQECRDMEAKKARLNALTQQIKAMTQNEALQQLRKEQKELQEELKKHEAPPSVDQSEDTDTDAEGDTDASDGNEGNGTSSDVRDKVAKAIDFLEDALDDPDWPVDDTEELQAILDAVYDAETKLAEVTTKAKALLADATPEPEAVPSGDN